MFFIAVIILNILTLVVCALNNRGYFYLSSSIVSIIAIGALHYKNEFIEKNIKIIIYIALIFNGISVIYDVIVLSKAVASGSIMRTIRTLTSYTFYTPIATFYFFYRVFRKHNNPDEGGDEA